MPAVYSASAYQSLALEPGEQTASQRLAALVNAGPGDVTTPNNVQPADQKAIYPSLCAVKIGTDADGLHQLAPDKIKIVVTLGADAYVEQTVFATNTSPNVASMGYYLARGRGNIVIGESQQIGDFPLERTVKASAEADATMAAIEAGTTHTGSIAETVDNCTFVKLAKVPSHTQVAFVTRTRLPNLNFAHVVSNEAEKTLFADAAILLPLAPLGAHVETTVRVVLRPGFQLSLPDKDAATHDAGYAFAQTDAVIWAERADFDHIFASGLACATVFQCRVTKAAPAEFDMVAALRDMTLIGNAGVPPAATAVRSRRIPVGFDPLTGVPRHVSLVDVDVPLGIQAPSKPNDLDFFLIVDESGSTYAKIGSNVSTNLQLAKQSTVAILTAFVKEHVPLLRRKGVLSEQQRVFVSVLMFHHGCRTIVDRLNVSDPASDLKRCCDAILADAPAGGTNFCSFATAMKAASAHTPDSLVVACVLTDGGAYDLPTFMNELHDLRSRVTDVRTVVVGFGAWVCEHTARRIQTDGHAMISDIDDTNVVRHAMRLVPKAVIAATRQVRLTLEGATIISAVRTDDADKALPLTTTLSGDGGANAFETSTLVEPGASLRILCLEGQGREIRVSCNGDTVMPFEAPEDDAFEPLEVLGMVDKLYLKAGVTLLPSGAREHLPVITAIGLDFELATSYTKPISTLKLPEAIVAPAITNRPVAESLVVMLTPDPQSHWGGYGDDHESMYCAYRSLSSPVGSPGGPVYRSLDAGAPDIGSPEPAPPPDVTTWLRCMADHVDRVPQHLLVSRLHQALDALEASSPGKRRRSAIFIEEDLLADIDAASGKHMPKPRHLCNLYPFSATSLDTARACYHVLCVVHAKQPVPMSDLGTAAQIRAAASFVSVDPH